jgi:hypothetical protein
MMTYLVAWSSLLRGLRISLPAVAIKQTLVTHIGYPWLCQTVSFDRHAHGLHVERHSDPGAFRHCYMIQTRRGKRVVGFDVAFANFWLTSKRDCVDTEVRSS